MTRKSRLSTSWLRLAPVIDALIEGKLGPLTGGEVRGLSRTLACWWVRHSLAPTPDPQRLCAIDWPQQRLGGAFRLLYEFFVGMATGREEIPTALQQLAALAQSRVVLAGDPPPRPLDVVNRVHELLLWLEAPAERRQRGAYYTPQAAARLLMQLAHEEVAEMRSDARGIWSQQVRVLDFAAGTGVFFAAAGELARESSQGAAGFSHWLSTELDAETHAIGVGCMALESFRVAAPWFPRFECADALSHREIGFGGATTSMAPFTVIVGNPPYSVFGDSDAVWLDALLRGRDPIEEAPRANYHAVAKQSAAERKHALSDDYVRFLRLAHWHLERAGSGVIALVLNHGILENRSFRGLRRTLSESFDRVLLLDLHGNAKQRELTPQGTRDESIFNIEQGTMIAVLTKWATPTQKKMQIGHLYGLRDEKLAKLISREWKKDLEEFTPAPPQFFFHCARRTAGRSAQLYAEAPSLAEIFPLHSTAIVTARDSLVVDENLDRLQARIKELRDLRISDEEIRAKYFVRRVHATQAAGDTRGWRLERVRRSLAVEGDDGVRYVGFWYRPWDYRWLAWSKHLIDWRRERFMPLLLGGDNLSIVARRQSPPNAPCNYFWTTNSIVADGILRSDNRGTEFVFPLYGAADDGGSRPFNIEPAFAQRQFDQFGLDGLQLFYSITGLLHARSYQGAFREELCRDFPRVLLPEDRVLVRRLCELGKQIAAAECHVEFGECPSPRHPFIGADPCVAQGFPRWKQDAIWINATSRWEGVLDAVWNRTAGAHQPILRWLKQRKGKRLSSEEITHVGRMLAATEALLTLQRELDACLEPLKWET